MRNTDVVGAAVLVLVCGALAGCGTFSSGPARASGAGANAGVIVSSSPASEAGESAPEGSYPDVTAALGEVGESPDAAYPDALTLSTASGLERGGSSTLETSVAQVSFATEGSDFDPDVSPDGSTVVFASTQHSSSANLYVKKVGSRSVTQLTSGEQSDAMPAYSPDGSRVAFASNRSGSWDIYVMPSDGGKAVQVTSDASTELHPSWSPDGTRLVFCRLGQTSGRWELWVTDVRSTGTTRFIGYGLFPEWCPTAGTGQNGADRIAFQRSRQRGDRAFSVWTLDYADGMSSNVTEIAYDGDEACINPVWSPDGKWIAFATVPGPASWSRLPGAKPTSADLWLIDAEGNGRVKLTSGKGVNVMPAWARDGSLYFVSDRGGSETIWSLSTAGAVALASGNLDGAPATHGMAHGSGHGSGHGASAPATMSAGHEAEMALQASGGHGAGASEPTHQATGHAEAEEYADAGHGESPDEHATAQADEHGGDEHH